MTAIPAGLPGVRESAEPARLVCSEVWGGNRAVDRAVALPGLRGWLFSQPCEQSGRGGDVHYLSVCSSGLLTRACVADVVGHGDAVATVGAELHALFRRYMNWSDERQVLRALNRRLERKGLGAMTTAAAVSYYPPSRSLSISYAGHPPAWVYRRSADAWERFAVGSQPETGRPRDLPLAVVAEADFSRRQTRLAEGDRVLLFTDGVIEAPLDGEYFGEERLGRLLHARRGEDCEALAGAILAELAPGSGRRFDHDDVTVLLLEVTRKPPGPTIWTAVKNMVLRPRGNVTGRRQHGE